MDNTHDCYVDTDTIDATWDRYARQKESEFLPHEKTTPTDDPLDENAWADEALMVTVALFERGVPGWEVPAEKQQMFAASLARVARKYWPGGGLHAERWGPWAHLGYASAMCALAGIDVRTWRFKARAKKEDAQDEAGPVEKPAGRCYTEGDT